MAGAVTTTAAPSARTFRVAVAAAFAATAAATVAWMGSMPSGMAMPSGWTMSMAWMRMPSQSWPLAAATYAAMWCLMMAPMMLPSLAPMLAAYRRSIRRRDRAHLGRLTAICALGYFAVWSALGVAIWPFGVAIAAAAMRWPAVERAMPFAAAGAVALAGVLQWSGWKSRQLARCCERFGCCVAIPGNPGSAWRTGLGLGVRCVRCCAPFTVVLLALGAMDLGVMAVVTAAITLERRAPRRELAARALGAAAVIFGTVSLAKAALGA